MIESIPIFLGVTLVFMGGCAFMAGQTLAANWRPLWHAIPYSLALGLADRFITFALFGGTLSSLPYYLTDAAVLTVVALAAYRMTQARRMADQYPWLYERAGLFDWRERGQPHP